MPRRHVTFAVPATANQYAPEVLYLDTTSTEPTDGDPVAELATFVESLPADAAVEVELLQPGGAVAVDSHWLTGGKRYTAPGLDVIGLAGWTGVRLRAKSGGTAGTAAVFAAWR